jgi:hypothetical protein
LIAIVALASGVAGCYVFPTSSSLTEKELSSKANAALATPATRAKVHDLLGDPWISSDRWRIEVYRKTGNYHELLVTLSLLPPVPLPLPIPGKKDLTGYTLVSYSPGGVVDAVGTAISKYPESPLAHIQAGDFAFTEQEPPPGSPIRTALQALIVSDERFTAPDVRIDVHSCTVLVGCSQMWCKSSAPIELQLDGDASTKYVMGTFGSGRRYPLMPLMPEPGAHTLNFSAVDKGGWGEVSTPFTCPPSALQYVIPTALVRRTHRIENLFWPHSRLEVTVQIQKDAPAELKESGVLLWTNGRWLVQR